eukprot:2100864-Prymnesium_polylepis.1
MVMARPTCTTPKKHQMSASDGASGSPALTRCDVWMNNLARAFNSAAPCLSALMRLSVLCLLRPSAALSSASRSVALVT